MPKKKKMGRPPKAQQPQKLTVYVLPRTKKAIRRALKQLPRKPHPTQGMVIDQWAAAATEQKGE